jgi:hypothetical protein
MKVIRLLPLLLLCVALPAVADKPLRIVDEKDAGESWQPAGGKPLVQPPRPANAAAGDVCMSLGYKINADGSTSDVSVLKVWSSTNKKVKADDPALAPYLQSGAAAISMWHFDPTPAETGRRPMFTAASFGFGADEASGAAVRSNCQISNLSAYVSRIQRQQTDANNRSEERYRNNNNASDAAVQQAMRRSNGGY